MTEPEAELHAVPLFRGLPPSRRADLLENVLLHTVPAGTVLFEQGAMPSFQHVVLAGSVQLFGRSSAGREVLVETVEPQDLVIPAAVVTASRYLMQARVPEPSRLLLIHAPAFRRIVEREPAVAREVIGSLAGQFRRLVRQIKNLKLRTASERVGCHLLALSQRQGTPGCAVLPYEKKLIASELGMTRESFSRALSALQADGITVKGDRIDIWDADRLAAACGPDLLIDDLAGHTPEPRSAPLRPGAGARRSRD